MKPLKIAITGDLSITGSFEKRIVSNEEIFSNEILKILKEVDVCITNLEGPVTDQTKYKPYEYQLKSPSKTISYLSKRNIKVYNLANNHIFDYGVSGFSNTLNELKKNNCIYFGAWLKNKGSKNKIEIRNDIKINLTSITERIRNKNKSLEIATAKYLQKNITSDRGLNIIFHHGGEEYTLFPSPTKRNFLKKIAKKYKPDFIISHHSHILQGFEEVDKTKIFYSLGNFIFDFPSHRLYDYTDESAILILTINNYNFEYNLIPIKINRDDGIIELSDKNIINRFQEISNFNHYKTKWRKEAFRVVTKRKDPEYLGTETKTLNKKRIIELFLNVKFYRKAMKTIFDKNNRSLYWNAFIHKTFYNVD